VSGERQLGGRREDPQPVVGGRFSGGSTNVVSDRFVQAAKRCRRSSLMPSPSSTTATGLPAYGTAVKTVDLAESAR
jgi:hypothetical protein